MAASAMAALKIGDPRGEPCNAASKDEKSYDVANYSKCETLIEVTPTSPKQAVFISNCNNTSFKVTSEKVKSVVFQNCLNGVEVVNCKSVQVHINGTVPGLQADKTDGLEVYTSQKSLGLKITHNLCANINLSIPLGGDEGFKEVAVPTQFVASWDSTTKKIVSEVSDIYG